MLEQRKASEPVALVREARLAYLEARVMEMDKREEEPFRLAGSASTTLDDAALEEALRQIRREWTPSAPLARPAPRPVRRRK